MMYFWILIYSLMIIYMNIMYLGHSHIPMPPSLQILPKFPLYSLYNIMSLWSYFLNGWVQLVLRISYGCRAPSTGAWATYHGPHPWGKPRPLLQQLLTANRQIATGSEVGGLLCHFPVPARVINFLLYFAYIQSLYHSSLHFFLTYELCPFQNIIYWFLRRLVVLWMNMAPTDLYICMPNLLWWTICKEKEVWPCVCVCP